ncbi:hypothetical protein DL767_007050 [Monosporascus sp. MG133]|nr:hypothetical protein DL767_007050 [Monosporascus sp. MG133]
MSLTLPPFVPFPESSWRNSILPEEWEACLSSWVALAEAHLSLSENEFLRLSVKDESLAPFFASFMRETASSGPSILGLSQSATALLRQSFLLTARLLRTPGTPLPLLQWEFLSDFSRVYTKKRTSNLINDLFKKPGETPETSLQALKKQLIISLDSGVKDDTGLLEARLKRLNHLIHASTDTAAFFLAGSDFLDGLISCYKVMNPRLRKTIITTAYLCLVGLTKGEPPKFSMLTDQLYSLKAAADAHKAGPINANDSMVPELVTVTPILKQIQWRLEASGSSTTRLKSITTALEAYRKPGGNVRPKRLTRRKIDKGKGIMTEDQDGIQGQMHVHRMSQISQIQDLFPDLGSGFVSKLLDESPERTRRKSRDIAPSSTPPRFPVRHNIYDDDELDRLSVDMSSLHFGKRDPGKTADDMLKDRSNAPNKAAILSALSAFDADDDERDDTYDAADAGFVVNDGHPEDADDQKRKDASEVVLFRAYQADPKSFDRDAATRRSQARGKLRQETGMTDEAIEGWAVMLGRSPQQMKQLEMKYSAFGGKQPALTPTAWRAGSEQDDSEADGGGASGSRGGGPRGRGRGRGGRGRAGAGRGGNVAGPTGDKETEQVRRRKEASKGSRANHNRRDQRARKMARGGLPG